MKQFDLRNQAQENRWHYLVSLNLLKQIIRRADLFLFGISYQKIVNILKVLIGFSLGRTTINALPLFIKIELSAACNLACTVCLHSRSNDHRHQDFSGRMPLTVFKKLVNEVKKQVLGLSLYYMGEALINYDIIEAINYATQNRLSTHISSNFSFPMSDEMLQAIIGSGLTHLTVCIDGLTNDINQRTRVNGNVELVIENLRRLIFERKKQNCLFPYIEVQFIQFDHNSHQLNEALRLFETLGVDYTAILKGSSHNYTDMHPDNYNIFLPLKKKIFPRCWWPWVSVTIKHNGDVLPCCYHRIADQFSSNRNCRAIGNIKSNSFVDIWNNIDYQNTRKVCNLPKLFVNQSSLRTHFCYGCDSLFDTDKWKNMR